MNGFSWLNRNIIALGLVSLCSDFGSEMATSVLPAFLVSIGASAAILGIIEGFANASNSFMSILAGWASDYTTKRKPFAAIGYLLAAFGISSLYLAHNWIMVLFGRILTRVGKGVRDPARDVLLVSSTTPKVYGRMFGFQRMMDNTGAIIGPLAALMLLRFIPLKYIFLIAFVPVFIAFLIIVFFVNEATITNGKILIRKEHIGKLSASFKWFVFAVGIYGLGSCAASLLVLRAIDILKPIIGTASADWYSILLYVLFNFFYAAFSYPVGVLADVWGKKNVIISGYLLTGLGLFGFISNNSHVWHIAILFLIIGIAYAIVDGVQRAMAADLLPHEIQGTGYGILAAVVGMGSLVSNIVVGFLWTTINPFIAFSYAAFFCIAGALCMVFVKKD
jgi:MFS family permease